MNVKFIEVITAMVLCLVTVHLIFQWKGISDEVTATRVLNEAGYTEIVVSDKHVFGCGRGEIYRTAFHAKGPTGIPTDGVVCKGLLSDSYIRH